MISISEQDEFLLSQLLDGELDSTAAEGLRARIEREPALEQAYARMHRLNGLLAARGATTASVDLPALRNEIMDSLRGSNAPAVIRFPAWKWAAGMLAAAASV